MAPFLGSITSHFSFPWKHLRISEMLLLWFCWFFFLSTGKKNENKNSIPRIASTCDSAVLDMTLMPNWGESRDANQSLLAFESCTLVILIVRDFSLSHFSLHKFYPEGKKKRHLRQHNPMKISVLPNWYFPSWALYTRHSFYIAA